MGFKPVGELLAGLLGEHPGAVRVHVPGIHEIRIGHGGGDGGRKHGQILVSGHHAIKEGTVAGRAWEIVGFSKEELGHGQTEPDDADAIRFGQFAEFVEVQFVVRMDDDGGGKDWRDVACIQLRTGRHGRLLLGIGDLGAGILDGTDGVFQTTEKGDVTGGEG
jgi:hypothetical protein